MSLAYWAGVTFRSCLSIFSHWSTGMLNRLDIRSISASTSARVTVTPCRRHSLGDQLLVDHALEHFGAVVAKALAGEVLAGDPLGVDRGHHRRASVVGGTTPVCRPLRPHSECRGPRPSCPDSSSACAPHGRRPRVGVPPEQRGPPRRRPLCRRSEPCSAGSAVAVAAPGSGARPRRRPCIARLPSRSLMVRPRAERVDSFRAISVPP